MPEANYEKLTALMCVRLAAPHTWPGPAVLTSVFGGVYSIAAGYTFVPVIWCLLLAVAVFAQSAVNTLNDWADYRAGTDTVENSDDPTDAVLVYNNPNPSHVLALGIVYMAAALVCGLICVVWCGSIVPLCLGLFGSVFIVIYSSGKIKISYLPLGELTSGVVMGALIPLAGISVFAYATDGACVGWPIACLQVVPFVIGIGMVMATQNNCDIERDKPVGRKTLPVVLGRRRSVVAYRIFTVLWVVLVIVLSFAFYQRGAWAACVTMVFGLGALRQLLTSPLVHEVRALSMGAVMKANFFLNGAYILAVMVSLF